MKKAVAFLAATALACCTASSAAQHSASRMSEFEKQAAQIDSLHHALQAQAQLQALQAQKDHRQVQATISQLQGQLDVLQDRQKKLLYAAIALAALLVGLGIYAAILNKKGKQTFNRKALNLLVNEEGKPLREFIADAARQIISAQPAKVDEAALKKLVLSIIRQAPPQAQPAAPSPAKEEAPGGQPAAKPEQVRYADSIRKDGFFNKVTEQPNDDTVFELKLENPASAQFTVYEKAYSRVMKRPEFLPPAGCNRQITGCSQLEATPGKAHEHGGCWKVVSKLNVKIL